MKERGLIMAKQLKRQWKGLAAFYRGHPGMLSGALIFTAFSSVLSLLLPLVYKFTVDTVLDGKDAGLPGFLATLLGQAGGRAFLVRNIWLMGLAIILITVVDGFLSYWRGLWTGVFAESGARKMRKSLYGHIQDLPFEYHVKAETGDLIQRCTSDVEAITRFFSTQLMEVVRSLTLVVFSIAVMFEMDSLMALIALAVTPAIFVTSALYFKKERDAFQKWDEAEGALSATLQENLTGIRVVKAFARQAFEREKFDEKNRNLLGHGWKTYLVIANFWMFSDFLCLLQIGAITIGGTLAVISGRITLGSLIVFISYTEMLLYPLRGLARIMADAGKMQISNSRIQQILEEPAEPGDEDLPEPELRGGIEFSHVGFSYSEDSRLILADLSFSIRPGETIGLIGPTGSGKSTLLYLLQRLYEPASGKILLDGMDIRGLKRSSVRRQVGLILQEPFVFSRNVFENIRLPRPDAEAEDVYTASRAAAFHDDVTAFSQGYETLVGERGVTLSGGQKQRLTIARTLIRECPVVVFDDSFSSVDTQTDQQIRQELRARKTKSTTILVSHRISTLSEADRILVLENGRITAQGSHAELIKIPGLYKRVYDIQNSLDLPEGGEAP
jgi:ATP-binding cassette, subfamily B, bacterial